MSLVALWVLAWRLLSLNEDRVVEYGSARVWGDFLRGRGVQTFRGQAKTIDDYLAALPADKRGAFQNFDSLKKPFTNLKQVDNLSGYRERSLWQRLQLWRLGTQPELTSTSVGFLMVLSLICIALTVSHAAGFSIRGWGHCGDILSGGHDESLQYLALLVQTPSSSGL